MLVIQGLTMGVLLLWMVRFCIRTSYRMLWPPICWAVLAFVGYAIIRYQQADLEYVAREELIRILIYAFLFLAILDNLNRQEAVQLVFFVLVFPGHGHRALCHLSVHYRFRASLDVQEAARLRGTRLRHVYLPKPLGGLSRDDFAVGPRLYAHGAVEAYGQSLPRLCLLDDPGRHWCFHISEDG